MILFMLLVVLACNLLMQFSYYGVSDLIFCPEDDIKAAIDFHSL